jgi:hypothetical protein
MNAKSINQVLAEMDDLPETMSLKGLSSSAAQVGRPNPATAKGLLGKPSPLRGKKLKPRGPDPERSARMMGKPSPTKGMKLPNMVLAKSKPCTADGVTVFPSLTALTKALGKGKTGTRSPNFRYIKDDK